MAITTHDPTVSINDGEKFPLDELDQHGDELAGAAGLDRARQLSFDVGGHEPNRSSVKASVDLMIPKELHKGSQVQIAVMTTGGEVLAQSTGKVIAVGFEDEYNKDGILVGTERSHKVKLAG